MSRNQKLKGQGKSNKLKAFGSKSFVSDQLIAQCTENCGATDSKIIFSSGFFYFFFGGSGERSTHFLMLVEMKNVMTLTLNAHDQIQGETHHHLTLYEAIIY